MVVFPDQWKKIAEKELKGDPVGLVRNTPENIAIKPIYTASDLNGIAHLNSLPGMWPYVRGPRATMYTGRPWTIRQYADFSTAEASNAFCRSALASGQKGLSVAFDLAVNRRSNFACRMTINMKQELVQLGGKIDWDWIDREIAPLYSEMGRPGIASRFVIGLLLLKHIYGLSDEDVCERWVYDPYFQHFTVEELFQHEFPARVAARALRPQPLAQAARQQAGALAGREPKGGARDRRVRTRDLKRVTVDTTVQPKAIIFPTDAKPERNQIGFLTDDEMSSARPCGSGRGAVDQIAKGWRGDREGGAHPFGVIESAGPPCVGWRASGITSMSMNGNNGIEVSIACSSSASATSKITTLP